MADPARVKPEEVEGVDQPLRPPPNPQITFSDPPPGIQKPTLREVNRTLIRRIPHLIDEVEELRNAVARLQAVKRERRGSPSREAQREESPPSSDDEGEDEDEDQPIFQREQTHDYLTRPIPDPQVFVQILQMIHPEIEFVDAVGTFANRPVANAFSANQSTVLQRVLEWRMVNEALRPIEGDTVPPPTLTFRDCMSDSLGKDALERANTIMWNATRIAEIRQDHLLLNFSPTIKANAIRARSRIATTLRRMSIAQWPLSVFMINDNMRNAFARFTAIVLQDSVTRVPASDMFDQTYARVQEAIFSECLIFVNCFLDGDQARLRGESPNAISDSSVMFQKFPSRRWVSQIRPSY